MRSSSLRNRRNRQTSAAPSNVVVHAAHTPSRVDTILSRSANIATACTLLLAVFGYFYTVLPVFQNQKLQEDNARLELDSAREKKTLADLQGRQLSVQHEISKLNSALVNAQGAASDSNERAQAAEQRVIAAKHVATLAENREQEAVLSAKDAQSSLHDQLENLDAARRMILVKQFRENVGFVKLRSHWEFISIIYERNEWDAKKDPKGDFLAESMEKFLSPKKILETALENVSKALARSQMPNTYSIALTKSVGQELSITCDVPNINSLVKQYRERESEISELSDKDARAELERQRSAAEKAGKRLLVGDGDVERFTRSYAVGRRSSLNEEYRKILIESNEACSELLDKAVDRIVIRIDPPK